MSLRTWSKNDVGRLRWNSTVRSSIFLLAFMSSAPSCAAAVAPVFGSSRRRIEKRTSSAVTVLPLWNSRPCLRRTVHTSAAAFGSHWSHSQLRSLNVPSSQTSVS